MTRLWPLSFISISWRKFLSLCMRLFAGHYFSFGGHWKTFLEANFSALLTPLWDKKLTLLKNRAHKTTKVKILWSRALILLSLRPLRTLKFAWLHSIPFSSENRIQCAPFCDIKKLRDKNYLWLLLTSSSSSITYPALKIYSRCRKSWLVCTLISKRKWILILRPRAQAMNQNTFLTAMQKC